MEEEKKKYTVKFTKTFDLNIDVITTSEEEAQEEAEAIIDGWGKQATLEELKSLERMKNEY